MTDNQTSYRFARAMLVCTSKKGVKLSLNTLQTDTKLNFEMNLKVEFTGNR